MSEALEPIKEALARFTERDLRALIVAIDQAPHTASNFLSWIDSVCHWEYGRRRGVNFDLQLPTAVVPPEENAASIDAAFAIRRTFADEKSSPVLAFFDALAEMLSHGAGRMQ